MLSPRRPWLAAPAERLRAWLAPGGPVDTDPVIAYPRLCLAGLHLGPPVQVSQAAIRNGKMHLAPGTYAFSLQSFCLEGGKHGPGPGSVYALAPLQGPRSALIRRVLHAAATSQVDKARVQALVWAIGSRTGYHGWSQEMRRTAEELLDERDLFVLGKRHWRLVPQPVRQLASHLLGWLLERNPSWQRLVGGLAAGRRVLADALATYEDIERVFLRPGAVPTAGPRRFQAEHWSLVPGGSFVRLFADSYQAARAEVYVPPPVAWAIERDEQCRVIRLRVDEGPEVTFEYADNPAGSDLGLPIWSFHRVSFRSTAFDCELFHSGWVARDVRQLAALDPKEHPSIAGRIQTARALVHDITQLSAFASASAEPAPGGAQGSSDPLQDIADLGHYVNGLEAIVEDLRNFPSHREKLRWLKEHCRRLREAYAYAASMLARLLRKATGQAPPRPTTHPWGTWFEPGEYVGLPDDPRKQALGFGRLHP